ncbi:hypothetical protein ACHQM5_004069 [Ranunculus cassubicifolius]
MFLECGRRRKFELKEYLKMKLEPSCLSALDELLHDIYIAGRPSSDNCSLRRELVRTFHVMAREVYGCHDGFPVVEAYGSFIMDIFSNNSDLDLSVNFTNDPAELPRNEKVKALRKFKTKLFQLQIKGRLCGVEPILTAKVPILRAVDCQTGIECDISVENKDGILKSQFVLIVSEIDERFQKLSSLMKAWAKANDINSSKDRTLNSIAIILLVAFHLQTREPPILPPFSLLLKDGIEPENVKKVVQEYLQYGKENKESVAELFVTLLSKLASVEDQWREGLCASTYEGSWISKTWDSKVGSISVEDFMDRAQNVARAVGPDQVEVIYECINDTMLHLWDFAEDRIQGDKLKEVLFGADEFTTLDEYNKRSRDTELRTFTPYKMSKREKKAARKAIRKEEQAVWKEEQAMKIGNFTVTEEGKNTVDFTVTEEGKNTVDYVTEKEEKTVDPIVTGMLPRRMSKRERRIARTAKRQAKRPMQSHDSIVTEKQETIIDSVVTGKEETAAVESVGVRRRENFAMQRVKIAKVERDEPIYQRYSLQPQNHSFAIPGLGHGHQYPRPNGGGLSWSPLQPSAGQMFPSPLPDGGHSWSPSQQSPVHMFPSPLPDGTRQRISWGPPRPPVPQFSRPAPVLPYGGGHQFWEHRSPPVAMHPPHNGGMHQFLEHSRPPVAMHLAPNGVGLPPNGGGHQFWEHSRTPVAMHPAPNGVGPPPAHIFPPRSHLFPPQRNSLPTQNHHLFPPQRNSLPTQNHHQSQAAPFHPHYHPNR